MTVKFTQDIKVFISSRESVCYRCREHLTKKTLITLDKEKRVLCMPCAELDQLVFLPAGDAAITRRARKNSDLFAVVLKYSRARKRYERQGLLVEEDALERAEKQSSEDKDNRAKQRRRASRRRSEEDKIYIKKFAQRVRDLYPNCPKGVDTVIAEHACLKYSGRVGRTSAAKAFDEQAVRLAVIAHIRHLETGYSNLLTDGYDRDEARAMVKGTIDKILSEWSGDD